VKDNFTITTMPKFSDEIIEALSVDCVIFGFSNGAISILLVKHNQGVTKGQWALPGSWIKYSESVDEAASRILTAQTSVSKIYLEQFKAYGDPDRFPYKRVITIVYYALVNKEDFVLHAGNAVSDVQWFEINAIPPMAFDHSLIANDCIKFLQHKVQHEPVGFNLLPKKFSLLQLQELYEAILNTKLDKPNFRRKFMKMQLLISCNEKEIDVSHRAASLYRFDKRVYDKLIKNGFSFEI